MSKNKILNPRLMRVYSKRYLKFDLVAAIVVFLVAIPLCLGIALASGAPLISGILSGVIGGIVVGSLSGSHVSVSGPAAGMAAIVVAAIAQLGDFNTFLLALTLAGLIQLFIGAFKAGFIADYVPTNVVQGLLCAIGILLIIKQLPLAFTLSADFNELKMHLLETTEEGLAISPLLALSEHLNTGAMIITFISLALLIYFDHTKNRILKEIPSPILVVILGIVFNELFMWFDLPLVQDSPQLVNIPKTEGLFDFLKQLQFPNWSAWLNPKIYFYAAIIAVVASLETLLNFKAGEKLDKLNRHSSSSQELIAQGVGNMAAGLIGGIPITSVIVRTSINIQAGAKTKISTILHGSFILFAVMIIPAALNKIPLSSLAAILIYTGYKLNKPSIYTNIYAQGLDRFIPFIVTVISIIVFNLLAGILIGLAVSFFYILKSNSQVRIDIIKEVYPNGETSRIVLPQQMTFLNKAALIAELSSIRKYSQLIIDARYAQFIDKEIIELLNEFKEEARSKQISLNLIGFQDSYKIHNYIDFITVTTYDVQANLSPSEVLKVLHEGNQRFLQDTRIHRSSRTDIKHTAKMQHPIAVVLGCIDSRVPVETIFDMTFGDLFCVRIAGTVVNNDILASIEYACNVVGAKLIVVLGHTRCGAIQSACNGIEKGHITQLLSKIKPAVHAEHQTTEERNGDNISFVTQVTQLNTANTLKNIYLQSDILRQMIDNDDIAMVGAMYDVHSGIVQYKNYESELVALKGAENTPLAEKLNGVLKLAKITNS
jgi:carbonic anhydrase